MRAHFRTHSARLACCLLAAGAAALAQTARPPSAASSSSDEVIELNPFVLTVETDEGYAPSETLSGTRLKALVKDVPSAISIISADILNDLGALNSNDVLDFLPSTARYQSNEGDLDNNGQRTGTPMTVRGFRSDSLTTNFFATMAPIDSYNTTRLTFTRGPNSIVFGVGNPGGGLDIVTNRPDLRRDSHSVNLRIDSFNSYRLNTDSSLVLVPGKLGLRVNFLEEDRRRFVEPARSHRTSLFSALGYRPAPGTTITVNGELNRIRQQVPRSVVAYDQVSYWMEMGRPMKPVYGNTAAVPGLEYNNANGHALVIEGQTDIPPMNWKSSAISGRYRVNGVLANRISFSQPLIIPMNINISGDGDAAHNDVGSISVIVQQAIGRRLFIEAAGRFEHQNVYNFEGLGGLDNVIRIDANQQLPNGQPNPNAGVPYLETVNNFWMKRWTDVAQGRLTASYELDLNRWRPFGRQLGSITFSGLYQSDRSHQVLDNQREVNETPLLTTGTFGRLDNGVNNLRRRYYLHPGRTPWFISNFSPVDANGIRSGWERVRATPRDNVTETNSWAASAMADMLNNLVVITTGVREDRAKQGQAVYLRDARGVFPPPEKPDSYIGDLSTGRTQSTGLVLNLTRQLGLFINRASNFQPSNQSSVDIFGNPAAPIEGEGWDGGIKMSFFNGRLQGSVEKFSTEQRNVTDGTVIGIKKQAIAAIWGAIDLNRVPSDQWTDFRTTRTTGYEFQLVGNPTPNLRLMLTASRNRTIVAERAQALKDYLARNRAEWQANASLPVVSTLGANVGALVERIDIEFANDLKEVGRRQTRSSEWQFSGVGRYRFAQNTPLNGFAVGSAVVWRDEPIIGYHTLPGSTLYDISQPFFGAKSLNVDAWIDYSRAILRKKVRWEAQLRVQNLLDDRTAKPWSALDDGFGGRLVEQRLLPNAIGVSLSSKFSF